MRAAGFAEAAQDGGVFRLHENQARLHRVADLREYRGETVQAAAFADIHHQGGGLELGTVAGEFRELGDQLHRQVVHRVIPKVFERLEHGTFARPAQAGDDDQLGFGGRIRRSTPGPARGRVSGFGRGCNTTARHGASGLDQVEMAIAAPH